jgi:peptidoglycan/xylan/chitin deacetylase (PgdA/CDA1 family)
VGTRDVVLRFAAAPPVASVVGLLERLVPGRTDALAVLTFHRVTPPGPDVVPGLLSATPAGFAELVEALARRHDVIGIDAVLKRAAGGPALPRRSLLLTFDDAYVDFAESAWPALRSRGLPAVLFVPTAFPDAPDRVFWWERLHRAITTSARPSLATAAGREMPLGSAAERDAAYRAMRDELKAMPNERLVETVDATVGELGGESTPSTVLDWESLRRLEAEGVALAPHTRTHPLLPRLDPSMLEDEIAGSRDDLAGHVGASVPAFAYPSGSVSPGVAAAVAAAGLRVAFTTARGVNDLRSASWMLLRRVNVSVRTPTALVRAQVLR